ncbi:MAG: OmpA family protein, partial [Chitinophagaceae bacterium]
RFFLGRKSAPLHISGTDPNAPSYCGQCDGSIVFHGLDAGKQARIQYKLNGAPTATVYSGVVSSSGTMTVPALCAGTYTEMRASEGNRSANADNVTLISPELQINAVSTDPTAPGACDATITLGGLSAGQNATITYAFNGKKQAAYVTTVGADNSVKLSGLCEGAYTDITVVSNKCTGHASPSSFVMNAPLPVKPVVIEEPKSVAPAEELKAILFDFNTSNIKPVSYSLIDDAYLAMKQDKNLHLIIEGNTDAIGSIPYNKALSERRALAVKTYLVKKGINKNRITMRANGKSEPVASNKTWEGRRLNRRAEMHLKIKD